MPSHKLTKRISQKDWEEYFLLDLGSEWIVVLQHDMVFQKIIGSLNSFHQLLGDPTYAHLEMILSTTNLIST